MRNHWKAGASALVLGLAFSTPALAQDGSSAVTDTDVITVTAQRVEQNIQDVPISVAVVTAQELVSRQIDGFDQLQFLVPGITFNSGINARQSATSIRGIGTGLFNIGVEASVAIAVDGVIMGREGAGIFDFADVERIEVLRGPQGTLFGKNASAGVVSVVTRAPTEEFEADFRASYGSFNEVNLFAAVSGPLSERVSARVSAYSNTRDGYIDNVFPGAPQSEVNDRGEHGVRGRLRFALSDASELLLSADYAARDQAAGALTYRQVSPGGPGTGLLGFGVPLIAQTSAGLGIQPGPENLSIGSEQPFSQDMESWGVSAEYTRPFGDFEFVSLSAYREWTSADNNDADLIPLPLLEINSGSLRQSQFSQELRIVSPRDRALTYSLGAYLFTQKLDQSNIQFGTAGLDLLGALPPGLRLGTQNDSFFEETNYALFGQGEYAVTDQLLLIAGLRVLRSEVNGGQLKSVAPGAVGPFAGQMVSTGLEAASANDTALVWRLGAQYLFDDYTNVFATLTRGYKSAGIVEGLTINPISGNALPVVAPEIPTQFEVGFRRISADGGVVTNLTLYYTQIEDFQAQTLIPGPSGTSIFTVANAGEVKTYGFEGEITARPTQALTLSAALAYNNAEFTEFPAAPCYALQTAAQGCNIVAGQPAQNLQGKTLANSPDWVINALTRYEFTLGGLNAYSQIGAQYRSELQSSITNDPNTIIGARTVVDAQVGIDFADGRGSLTVFGRNLFNESFPEAIVNMPFDLGGYAQFLTLEAQRTFGLTLSMRY